MDNIMNGWDDEQFEQHLDQLTELVFKKLIERYGPIYPLNLYCSKK